MTDESDKLTTTVHVPDGEYISPGSPGYDQQVLHISRQITFAVALPITDYPNMSVSAAIEYEQNLGFEEVIEALHWADNIPGSSIDMRTHVAIRRTVTEDQAGE